MAAEGTDYKVVHDAVHGSIRVDGLYHALLETPELQRLHSVHQLGLAYLVFPGARHSRLEHSLGAYHVAGQMARALHLDADEAALVRAAALLHDLGHPPFSHTLEFLLKDLLGGDHMETTQRLILGKETIVLPQERAHLPEGPSVAELLEGAGLEPRTVASLVASEPVWSTPVQATLGPRRRTGQSYFNGPQYLVQLIHGPIDVDQIDYLLRDAYYTGVAQGIVDLDRLLQTVELYHGDLAVHRRGVPAVEGLLVARALMYTSVYFHKTVRIAELMLVKAVERLSEEEIASVHRETDGGLFALLRAKGGFFAEIAAMLKYRRLFKKAFVLNTSELTPAQAEALAELNDYWKRREVEAELARRARVPDGYLIIDVPEREILLAEPRIGKTGVKILDDGKIRSLPKLSPLAASLQLRAVHDWGVLVSCAPQYRAAVTKAAPKVLFG